MQYVSFLIIGIVGVILVGLILVKQRKKLQQEDIESMKEDILSEPDDGVIAVRKKNDNTKQDASTPLKKSTEDKTDNPITILHVIAKKGKTFAGYELLQIILSSGLRFGDMNIFHYYQNPEAQENVLFSLASATEPGIFDLAKMDTFSCKGLSLFMQKTGDEEEDKTRYTHMLETAAHLAEDLGGLLLNSQKQLVPMKQGAIA